MSAIDLIRLGVAGAASLGAAVGGFAASQNDTQVVGVAAPEPPLVSARELLPAPTPISFSMEEWTTGLALPTVQTAIVAQPEMRPWRFVGVIGEGHGAKAVFASPDAPGRTMMASVGDTLPDGRVIAAVASEHVLFGAMTNGRPGGVAAASGVVGPQQISLFSGGAGNREAEQAFTAAQAAPTPPTAPTAAPAAIPQLSLSTDPDVTNPGVAPFGNLREPASAPTN